MSKLLLFRDTQGATEQCGPPPDRFVWGHPTSDNRTVFESVDGKIVSGIWRATIGAWRIAYDETEYCHVTKGRARLLEDSGAIFEIQAGDSFVIAAGFTGIWEVIEDMEKHYMVVMP